MKLIPLTAAIALILTPAVASAHTAEAANKAPLPHLTTATAIPHNSRVPWATYRFGLHVSKEPFSQLIIEMPERIRFSGRTTITDQSGQNLTHTTQMDGRRVIITFAQPVSPGSRLEIKLLSVQPPRGGNHIWLLPVSIQGESLMTEIRLGIARIHTYSH